MKLTKQKLKTIVESVLREQSNEPDEDSERERLVKLIESNPDMLDIYRESGDDGIGYYEYGSTSGIDSRPYDYLKAKGDIKLSWRGDFDIYDFDANIVFEGDEFELHFEQLQDRVFDGEESTATFIYEYEKHFSPSDYE